MRRNPMKVFLIICLLITLPACASFRESWKENSATAPDGSASEGSVKFSLGVLEGTESEEKTDRYDRRDSSPVDNLSIGISNSWDF
jgi:hypothetical protein